MNVLNPVSEKRAIGHEHFPNHVCAVIWRLWGIVDPEKLAKALDATVGQLKEIAALMGLDPEKAYDPIWKKRGYITIIRDTWHLMEYDQICTLLDYTESELATILKEDDFLLHKLGHIKPSVDRPKYRPLTEAEREGAKKIAALIASYDGRIGGCRDNAFRFLDDFYREPEPVLTIPDKNGDLKMIYSYFALYGDPLLDPDIDPFPDALLAKYASYGINGVWLQGVLYQLVPYAFAPSYSEGWETRIRSLNALVRRAEKYGIGVYLYLNEPRNMPLSFFEKYPQLKGHERPELPGFPSLCTSTKEVQDYLKNSARLLFESVPGLGGFFTITRSENQTNCYSHSFEENCNCPRCAKRPLEEVVAEVNNLLAEGAHAADPKAKAIAWNWGWTVNGKLEKIIRHLDRDIIVQATSETGIPYEIGGVKSTISDYSMSIPGPGELARETWNAALDGGHQTSAKVQFNNSWEISGVPYVPVFDLVAEHVCNLKTAGVKHFMYSWTLGGCPSPNLGLAGYLLNKENASVADVRDYVAELFPEREADTVYRVQRQLCRAFREFPFHISVLYVAPQTSGPKAPFFVKPSGYSATMVGYPFDALENWRAIFPEEVYIRQMRRTCEEWEKGIEMIRAYRGEKSPLFEELYHCAMGVLVHYRTTLHLSVFTGARNQYLKNPENALLKTMLDCLDREEENVLDTIALFSRDSRIGFEASNQYNFTMADLKEKLLNIHTCREYYKA